MSAAHGMPRVVRLGEAAPPTDHQEAVASAHRLRRGVAATLVCTAALVAAVATTWYGVPAEGPALHITLPDGGTHCGSALIEGPGGARLTTKDGTVVLTPGTTITTRAGTPCS